MKRSSIWISQVGLQPFWLSILQPETLRGSTPRFASEDACRLLACADLPMESEDSCVCTLCRARDCLHSPYAYLASARKEVIQPHLPVRLPCYDFVPVISPTLGSSSLAVRSPTSGVTNSHDVTGGVYKARERIHRSMADLRLLATPASCRRVAAYNPNYEQL